MMREIEGMNGTWFSPGTPREIQEILERLRADQTRVRFHWGDPETGKDWCEHYGVYGRVSRSTGPHPIHILVHNRRSTGGGAILTANIVRIVESRGGREIYRHPKYHD